MRIAIFESRDETLILQVKGTKKDFSSIDGIEKYFSPDNRDLSEYKVTMAHIGSGEGVSIIPKLSVDADGRTEDIDEWFPLNEFGEPTMPRIV